MLVNLEGKTLMPAFIDASGGATTMQEGATYARDLSLMLNVAAQDRLYLDLVSLLLILEIPALVKEYAPDFQGGPMEMPG